MSEAFSQFLERTRREEFTFQNRKPLGKAGAAPDLTEIRDYVLRLYANVNVERTFTGQDGHDYDCIPSEQQPSLQKGRGTAMATAPAPVATLPEGTLSYPVDRPSCEAGGGDIPAGTVPVRRVRVEEIAAHGSLRRFLSKGGKGQAPPRLAPDVAEADAGDIPHRYAYGSENRINVGASAILNLWAPRPANNMFSLSQIWVSARSDHGLQTVEAGWQVWPAKYGTTSPVLFVYWTADGYKSTGAYNLEGPGFVQTNRNWTLGAPFSTTSLLDGRQVEFWLQWQRDPATGNWWLYAQSSSGVEPIGYCPPEIFGGGPLGQGATSVAFGGEVTGSISGQMGSGQAASGQYRRAAYQRIVRVLPSFGQFQQASLVLQTAEAGNYTISPAEETGWETAFFFGGGGFQ